MKHVVRGLLWGAIALTYLAFFAVAGYFAFGGFGIAFAVIATNPWVFLELTIMHAVLGDAYQSISFAIIIAIVVILQFLLACIAGIVYHSGDDKPVIKRSVL